MRNLEMVAMECMKELDVIGVEYRKPTKWIVNNRALRRYGQCSKEDDGFHISITWRLLDERIPVEYLKDTIIHELVHTVPGCFNHLAKFREIASYINDCYSCYHISRCVDPWVYKLVEEYYPEKEMGLYKYMVSCQGCDASWLYQRKNNVVKNPSNYHCGSCNGRLKVKCL